MYAVSEGKSESHWSEDLIWQGVGSLIFLVLAAFLAGLGDKGLITAAIVAPLILLGVVWKVARGGREEAIAKHGRYYCQPCSQHFEGDELRQITQ
jgi:hypothetical protein